jgi:hypothetical protein
MVEHVMPDKERNLKMKLARRVLMVVAVGTLSACGGGPRLTPPIGAAPHDPVIIDRTQLLQLESFPVEIVLKVEGQLPDPCHEAVWSVSEPDVDGRIAVELHSEAPSGLDCIQVIQPLSLSIPIGSFRTGSYSVWLNGDKVGAFDL